VQEFLSLQRRTQSASGMQSSAKRGILRFEACPLPRFKAIPGLLLFAAQCPGDVPRERHQLEAVPGLQVPAVRDGHRRRVGPPHASLRPREPLHGETATDHRLPHRAHARGLGEGDHSCGLQGQSGRRNEHRRVPTKHVVEDTRDLVAGMSSLGLI
jgi:hypothetical protein